MRSADARAARHGWLPACGVPALEAVRLRHEGIVSHRVLLLRALDVLAAAGERAEVRELVSALRALDDQLQAVAHRAIDVVHQVAAELERWAGDAGAHPVEAAGARGVLADAVEPGPLLRELAFDLQAVRARWLVATALPFGMREAVAV